MTKYSANDSIGQCTVEEVVDDEPTIAESDVYAAAPAEKAKPIELPAVRE